MAWQDVVFAGGLHTATQPASSPEGTLAESTNADVSAGSVRRRAGLILLGTPAGLAATPVVKAVGWGAHAGIQEILYAVTDATGGTTVYKWAPGDAAPIAISPSLDINLSIVISHGAFGKYVYVATSNGTVSSWYRHQLGTVPPNAEAFKALVGASSVPAPGSMDYAFSPSLPTYRPFGASGDGSSVLYTATGTAPTSVTLFSTYVKALYPTNTEPGSELEVTVTLGGSKQFSIAYNDAMAIQFLMRNCTLNVRYIELETSGGATWRGRVWGATQGGGHVATSWVLFPIQQERRDLRDTELVTKVRFKFALTTVNSAATPEVWIDSPRIGGTYLWYDPWLNPAEQPMKYAAQYIDNGGLRSPVGAITEVPDPERDTWEGSIGTHLNLTPAPSSDPNMSAGQIAVLRALRVGTKREERWYQVGTVANNVNTPGSVTDRILPREHSRTVEISTTTLPISGQVLAIIPHKERLFVAIDNEIWVSGMGTPERFVVDPGFDPLAPTAPEKHFASSDQSARVVAFASGDALLVCTDKGAYIEFGWPDQLAYQRVKVFDDPTGHATAAMGASMFTSTLGLFATSQSGELQEVSDAIRGSYNEHRVTVHRGTVYMVRGTDVKYRARTGAWHAATLPVSLYAMFGGFSNLAYPLCVGNNGKLYGLSQSQATDDGVPITWRVVTNMAKVPDAIPVEVRYAATGTQPVIKLLVPGRGEVPVATFGQAGFTSQDFNGLGLQVVVEGSGDTVLNILQVRWEPDGDRPMQLNV